MAKNVLVLDENPIVHGVVSSALGGGAVFVHHEFNSKRFLEKTLSLLPDLILIGSLDYDSEFTLHRSFAEEEKLQGIPLVLLLSPKTSLTMELKKSLKLARVLLKPLEASEVKELVASQLAVDFQDEANPSEIRVKAVGNILDEEVASMLKKAGAQPAPPRAPSKKAEDEVYQLETKELEEVPATQPSEFAYQAGAGNKKATDNKKATNNKEATTGEAVKPSSLEEAPPAMPAMPALTATDPAPENLTAKMGVSLAGSNRSAPEFKADTISPEEQPFDEAFPYLPHLYENSFKNPSARIVIFPKGAITEEKARPLLHLKPTKPLRPSVLPIKAPTGQVWVSQPKLKSTVATPIAKDVLNQAFEDANQLKKEDPFSQFPPVASSEKQDQQASTVEEYGGTPDASASVSDVNEGIAMASYGLPQEFVSLKHDEAIAETVQPEADTTATVLAAETESTENTEISDNSGAVEDSNEVTNVNVEQFKETVLRPLSNDNEVPAVDQNEESNETEVSLAEDTLAETIVPAVEYAIEKEETSFKIEDSQLAADEDNHGDEEFILLGEKEKDDLIELPASQLQDVFSFMQEPSVNKLNVMENKETTFVSNVEQVLSDTSDDAPAILEDQTNEEQAEITKAGKTEGSTEDNTKDNNEDNTEDNTEDNVNKLQTAEIAGENYKKSDDSTNYDELSDIEDISETASLARITAPQESEQVKEILDDIISQSVEDAVQSQASKIEELEKEVGKN